MTLKQKLAAHVWHEENGVFCGTCIHFKTLSKERRGEEEIRWTYCEYRPYGPAMWPHEYCNLWEAKDETGQG